MDYANNRTAVANSIIWCYFSPQHSVALLDPALSKYRHLPGGIVQTLSLIWNEVMKCIFIKAHWIAFFNFNFLYFSRVWKAFSILLLIPHKRGAPKNTGEYISFFINVWFYFTVFAFLSARGLYVLIQPCCSTQWDYFRNANYSVFTFFKFGLFVQNVLYNYNVYND